ncbi:MAG TPA: AMP-binding protein [Solirubrobacteraceae bacterium]|nr:AMP-binding protein [Solirubrobacteraceae bacterium]
MSFDVTSLHGRRAAGRWERLSVGDILERLTYSFPEREALVGWEGAYAYPEHRRLTYRQADTLTNRIAGALLARGLRRSDRVLMVCENSNEAMLVKLACAKAGLVAMPINPSLAADVVAALIERCEPALGIVDAELLGAAERAGARVDVTIPIGEPSGAADGACSFAEFIAGASEQEPDVEIHGDDIWEILFTSGTTALPKAVMLSHVYTYIAGHAHAISLGRGVQVEGDVVITDFLPMIYHVGGHILPPAAWFCGGTFVMGRRYDPQAEAAAITAERITGIFAGQSVMVQALADALEGDPDRFDGHSLQVLMYGWSQVSPELVERLKRLCGEQLSLVEIFGQTESITNHRFWVEQWPEVHRERAPADNYVGVPCPMLASVVVDPATPGATPVAPGVPGEAVYRSPAMTAGYYRDEQATREAFRDGWFHSGDSCVVDEGGRRIMVDRYKDIVKTGGENVSSLRVESIVQQHPEVAKAAVVGLPHERWGEAVTAFAVPAGGTRPEEASMLAFCRERLAGYEVPKRIVLVDALPETVGGKVLKYRLREEHTALYRG